MSGFSDGVTAPEEQQQQAQESQEQQTEDYLAEMVGEGKKYSSVEEAAQALAKKAVNADNFIETLKTEKTELESKYNELQTRNKSIDEIIAAIKAEDEQNAQQQAPTQQQQETQSGEAQLSIDDIIAKLEERQEEKTQAQKRAEAIESTWGMLSSEDVFGDMDKAKAAVSQYIGKDESRKALVDSMAVTDPQGLAVLLKQGPAATTFTEDYSGRSSEEPTAAAKTGKLTWDIARKVRKENPDVYYSKAFQNRMHNEL